MFGPSKARRTHRTLLTVRTKTTNSKSISCLTTTTTTKNNNNNNENKQTNTQVDFLDTSGSMQFPAMRRLSLTTGSAFLMVYAIDDENSYEVLKMCMQELQEVRPDFQEIPIVFAGNKCDQAPDRRKLTKELVSNYVHYELPRLRAKVSLSTCAFFPFSFSSFSSCSSLSCFSSRLECEICARRKKDCAIIMSTTLARRESTSTCLIGGGPYRLCELKVDVGRLQSRREDRRRRRSSVCSLLLVYLLGGQKFRSTGVE